MGPQIAVSLGLGQPRVWSVALGRCEPKLLRPGTGPAPERATSRRAAASTQKEHWASSGLAMHSKLLRPGTGRAPEDRRAGCNPTSWLALRTDSGINGASIRKAICDSFL